MWLLHTRDLAALRLGARALGSGGGGDPYWFAELARHVMGDREIPVHEASDLPQACVVVSTGLVGSVTDFNERPANGSEFARAVDQLVSHQSHVGPAYVSSYESAGANAFAAVTVCAITGLPLVDIDPMGRGLSWLDQTTYDAAGLPICPFVVTDPAGHSLTADGLSGVEAERFLRNITVLMGGWSAFAGYLTSGQEAVAHGVHGALARGLAIGRTLLAVAPGSAGPALVAEHAARHVGSGRVAQALWRQTESGDVGSVVIRSSAGPGTFLRIECRNEFVAVVDSGYVTASAPDIICLLTRRDSTPLLAEGVTLGAEVDVVVLPAPLPWQREAFRAKVSPAAFGLDLGAC